MTVGNFFSRFAVLFKLALIGVLLLLMLIPLAMLYSTLNERLDYRNQAVGDITSTWGKAQTIVGPLLKVPYNKLVKETENRLVDGKTLTVKVERQTVDYAWFLPASLTVSGTLEPQRLKRGIYETVVWHADSEFTGAFDLSGWRGLGVSEKDFRWSEAELCVMVSDLRGVRENIALDFGNPPAPDSGAQGESHPYVFMPGSGIRDYPGIHAAVAVSAPPVIKKTGAPQPLPFAFKLSLNGSDTFHIAPAGRETRAQLASPWPHPSFSGVFSPVARSVSADGFTASWELSHYALNHPQPQQWTGDDGDFFPLLATSPLGVRLIEPVDSYRNMERAVKYAALFITLVFTAYFLFEILSKQKIHPFQYLLVGAAVCLFYLGILSLSELLPFGWAYLASAAAAWAMISLYTLSVLKSGRRTLIIAALLAVIEAFIYIVLQLQDYSLVFGTALLFIMLGAVMFVTRRVDWYKANADSEV